MRGAGAIIRLVDVVLILLIGFVSISRFEQKWQMDIPPTRVKGEKEQPAIPSMLVVKIESSGYFQVILGKYKKRCNTLGEIEKEILRYHRQNKDIIVAIDPSNDSLVQWTVDVVEICLKHHIKNGVRMDLSHS